MNERFRQVSYAVADRSLRKVLSTPSLFLPPLIMPVIFFAAFAGGLSTLGRAPGFDFPSGYTSFQFVFVLMQAAVFTGIFSGFGIARDFETGFGRRLMLAAPDRRAIVAGYVLGAIARALISAVVVFAAGLIAGMRLDGSALQIVLLFVLAMTFAGIGSLWAAGIAMRFRTIQAAPLMQVPIFLALFIAPVFVPLELLTGWISAVAQYNPVTAFLEAGRGLISGRPDGTLVAYAISLVMLAVLTVWSITGMRAAERAGA